MAKNKTTETIHSVANFLAAIKDENKRKDCITIVDLISKQLELEPKMWGTSIIGFGSYHYKYESGHEGDAPLTGLSPRAAAIVFYLSANFENREKLLKSLGKHKTGKGCIYIKKLEDIDSKVLITMVKESIEHVRKIYPD